MCKAFMYSLSSRQWTVCTIWYPNTHTYFYNHERIGPLRGILIETLAVQKEVSNNATTRKTYCCALNTRRINMDVHALLLVNRMICLTDHIIASEYEV
jgi:hypothetical protein